MRSPYSGPERRFTANRQPPSQRLTKELLGPLGPSSAGYGVVSHSSGLPKPNSSTPSSTYAMSPRLSRSCHSAHLQDDYCWSVRAVAGAVHRQPVRLLKSGRVGKHLAPVAVHRERMHSGVSCLPGDVQLPKPCGSGILADQFDGLVAFGRIRHGTKRNAES